ncbi:renalase-like isoform X2 [Anneissia japonica]|nr:renalase-like isoform X2 [Anneissia japonica]
MSTSRSASNPNSTVDLGAQYISCTPAYASSHAQFYSELISNHILTPCQVVIEGMRDSDGDTKHYVTPKGTSSIVKYYLQQSGANIHHNCHLQTIDVKCDDGVETILAEHQGSDQKHSFDVVVLSQPVPQILQLGGGIQDILAKNSNVLKKLEEVEYSSRYALGLYFSPGTKFDVPWEGKYTYDDPCVRWICIDSKKRGNESDADGPTLTVHTSVPFGLKHLEDNKQDVQKIILQHLSTLLPGLPEPVEVKCQRWRYSQVYKGVEGGPGCMKLAESKTSLLLAAGDAFVHSNFDGCIESAKKTSHTIIDFLKSNCKL